MLNTMVCKFNKNNYKYISLNINFESKTNPKCFWAGQRLKGSLLNVVDGWGTF